MLKTKRLSLWTLWAILAVVMVCRLASPKWEPKPGNGILTWDVFGYYLYLPATFIYDDLERCEFAPALIEKYQNTGTFYQVTHLEDGKVVMKYTMGLSMLYSPFFFMGHLAAMATGAETDGLSPPYQFFIGLSAIFYFFLGLIFLRKVLLRYFDERITAGTLLLVALGTNLLQFTAFDGAMPHSYLFALYALILWLTIRWHEQPSIWRAFFLGLTIGLAALIRPTEIIALMIPALWGIRSFKDILPRIKLLLKHWPHLLLLGFGVFLAGLPQLLYWKSITGSFLHYTYGEEGFVFSRPHIYNVLFSFRKGWYIYTPIMLVATVGFIQLYRRHHELFWTLVPFFLLNTYIIASWSVWWYAGSFGHRAFIQSYPIMAIPLAALLAAFMKLEIKPLRGAFLWVVGFFFVLNIFQHYQYTHYLIDPSRMTAEYYWHIFGRITGKDVDRRLLTTEEFYDPAEEYIKDYSLYTSHEVLRLNFDSPDDQQKYAERLNSSAGWNGSPAYVIEGEHIYAPGLECTVPELDYVRNSWLKVTAKVKPTVPYAESPANLVVSFESMGKMYKYRSIPLDSFAVTPNEWTDIQLECIIPEIRYNDDKVKAYIYNQAQAAWHIDDFVVEVYEPNWMK